VQSAVSFQRVSKKFTVNHNRSHTFQELLVNLFPREGQGRVASKEALWVLRDVSFDVPVGKTLGIVGDNGSGKSTALKLISGILRPTSGSIHVKGRVSALLELGAGFHPDLSGRENVFLAGTILGMSQAEMRRRFDEIVAFSELERVIDTPVKHYSSGMYMRLAFSVATSVDPDILLVDEVLAVGDSSFQKKCFERIRSFQKAGLTIVLVSHDLASVSEICSSAIWLHKGELRSHGPANQVVNSYLEFTSLGDREAEGSSSANYRRLLDEEHPVRITKVETRGADGEPRVFFKTGEDMLISIGYVALDGAPRAAFGVTIARSDGTYCYATNMRSDRLEGVELQEEGEVQIRFNPLTLLPGTFFVHAVIFEPVRHTHYDFREHAAMFKIRSDRTDYGVAVLPHQWLLAGTPAPEDRGLRSED
jgi:ABC-type polysaccharide/polyol phosphate transport system ATPase subunit